MSHCATAGWKWVAFALPLFGCLLPWVHSRREERHTPQAVQRFSDKAMGLTHAQGAPSLSEVTYSMSAAIEALPEVQGGGQLALEVSKRAEAMTERPQEAEALARVSLETALTAVQRAKPYRPQKERDKAVELAQQAIEKVEPGQPATLQVAYREVARAMIVITGGTGVETGGNELSQLTARFAVEEPDDARRTGSQVIASMGDALERRPQPPEHAGRIAKELRKRAERLAAASALDYARQLKEALLLVVHSLDRPAAPRAETRLLYEARAAIEAIRADRPIELQHAAAATALRLVTEAIMVSLNPP